MSPEDCILWMEQIDNGGGANCCLGDCKNKADVVWHFEGKIFPVCDKDLFNGAVKAVEAYRKVNS